MSSNWVANMVAKLGGEIWWPTWWQNWEANLVAKLAAKAAAKGVAKKTMEQVSGMYCTVYTLKWLKQIERQTEVCLGAVDQDSEPTSKSFSLLVIL